MSPVDIESDFVVCCRCRL